MQISEAIKLDAGAELDEFICRLVGWSVSENPMQNSATLWSPSNEMINTWGSSEAWPHVVKIAWYNAPRYSRDASAALTLPLGPKCWLAVESPIEQIDWTAKIDSFYNRDEEPLSHAEADSPALAICRAWLAWKETRN